MTKVFVIVAGILALVSGTDWIQFGGLVVTVGGTIFVAVYSQNASRRTQTELRRQESEAREKASRTEVEAQAFARARESYEATIRSTNQDLARSRAREDELSTRLDRAFRRIGILEGILRDMGAPVPPPEKD